MIQKELEKIIKNGESNTVEFKSWIKASGMKERIKLAVEELVAFSNSKGGTVYFGIEDNGEVTGCDEDINLQNIIEAIYDKTRPPLFVDADKINYKDKIVVTLKVEADGDIHSISDGRYLKRLGKNSKPFYPSDSTNRLSTSNIPDYSSKILSDSTLDDIDYLEVYKIKNRLKTRDNESMLSMLEDQPFLRDLELIKSDRDKEKLTVAGLLFVGKQEAIKRMLPQAEVIYLHYDKSNPLEYDAREDMKFPIVTILDKLTDRIKNYNKIINVQVGLFRMEISDFSEKVFQEAVLNAMAHRDYESMGSIYVKHYDDRIVIESPGGFIGGVNEKNIITHPSVARNKLICETLQRLRYVQRTGQGVDIIYQDTVALGKPLPIYRVFEDSVVLTISSVTENETFIKFIAEEQEKVQRRFTLFELLLLRYLTDNRSVTLKRVQEVTQQATDDSRRTCNNLINLGLIELNGKSYMLTARVYNAIKSDIEYVRDHTIRYIKAKEMILEYLNTHPFIRNTDIQEMCGFTKQQSRITLDKMREEKLLELVKRGRKSYYIRVA